MSHPEETSPPRQRVEFQDDREEQRRWFRQLEYENHGDNVLEVDSPTSGEHPPRRRAQSLTRDPPGRGPSNGAEAGDRDYAPWSSPDRDRVDQRQAPDRERSAKPDHQRRPPSPPRRSGSYQPRPPPRFEDAAADFERLDGDCVPAYEDDEGGEYVPRNRGHDHDYWTRGRPRGRGDQWLDRGRCPPSPPRGPFRPDATNPRHRWGTMDRNNSCRPNRSPSSQGSKIKMKPESYEGKEDFDSYLERFETCALLSSWSTRERSLVLSAMMKGAARTFFQTLPENVKNDYRLLIASLQGRFGSTSKHTQYWMTKFAERTRKSEEPVAAFADEILLLAQKAYPRDMTQENLNQVALQQLYKSLEPETKWKCIEKKCESIWEAVEVVETYEMFAKGGGRKAARQVTASPEDCEEMTELLRRVQSFGKDPDHKGSDRDRFKREGGPCYLCKTSGHRFATCPSWDKLQNLVKQATGSSANGAKSSQSGN